jgi:hypothetical protein
VTQYFENVPHIWALLKVFNHEANLTISLNIMKITQGNMGERDLTPTI